VPPRRKTRVNPNHFHQRQKKTAQKAAHKTVKPATKAAEKAGHKVKVVHPSKKVQSKRTRAVMKTKHVKKAIQHEAKQSQHAAKKQEARQQQAKVTVTASTLGNKGKHAVAENAQTSKPVHNQSQKLPKKSQKLPQKFIFLKDELQDAVTAVRAANSAAPKKKTSTKDDAQMKKYLKHAKNVLQKLHAPILEDGKLPPKALQKITNSAAVDAAAAATKDIEERIRRHAANAGAQAGIAFAEKQIAQNPSEVAASIESRLEHFKYKPSQFNADSVAKEAAGVVNTAAQNALADAPSSARDSLKQEIHKEDAAIKHPFSQSEVMQLGRAAASKDASRSARQGKEKKDAAIKTAQMAPEGCPTARCRSCSVGQKVEWLPKKLDSVTGCPQLCNFKCVGALTLKPKASLKKTVKKTVKSKHSGSATGIQNAVKKAVQDALHKHSSEHHSSKTAEDALSLAAKSAASEAVQTEMRFLRKKTAKKSRTMGNVENPASSQAPKQGPEMIGDLVALASNRAVNRQMKALKQPKQQPAELRENVETAPQSLQEADMVMPPVQHAQALPKIAKAAISVYERTKSAQARSLSLGMPPLPLKSGKAARTNAVATSAQGVKSNMPPQIEVSAVVDEDFAKVFDGVH
jgi:hypothetical protein